jgi:hypothetical protein
VVKKHDEDFNCGEEPIDDPEAYRALCELWAREEFIAKSIKAQECRGTGGQPGHTYVPDGHICTGQQTVRKIVTKMYSHFVFSY